MAGAGLSNKPSGLLASGPDPSEGKQSLCWALGWLLVFWRKIFGVLFLAGGDFPTFPSQYAERKGLLS